MMSVCYRQREIKGCREVGNRSCSSIGSRYYSHRICNEYIESVLVMSEHSQETKIAILEAKVEHMMGHVKELTLRVRANEKVVASVSLLGVIACTFIGAGYLSLIHI